MIKFLAKFFTSKINWLVIVLILTTLSDEISKLDFTGMTWQQVVQTVIGFLIMIIRTYFIQKPITKKVEERVTILPKE